MLAFVPNNDMYGLGYPQLIALMVKSKQVDVVLLYVPLKNQAFYRVTVLV